MNTGGSYWNEDAQQWEPAPPTPPPSSPPPPDLPPPPTEPPPGADADGAAEDGTSDKGARDAAEVSDAAGPADADDGAANAADTPGEPGSGGGGRVPGSGFPAPPLAAPVWSPRRRPSAPRPTPPDPGAGTPGPELPTQYAAPPPPAAYPPVHEPGPPPGHVPGQEGAYDPYGAYTPYPGGFELGPEHDDRSHRRGVVAAVVGLAVVVAGALGAGGWLLFGDDGEDTAKPEQSATGEPKPTADNPDPSQSSGPPPSPSASSLPPGYVLAAENGYSLAVPDDWERRVDGVSVFYEDPATGGAFAQVYEVTEDVTPYEAVQIIEETKQDADGYRLNDLADLGDAAEYDYSYVDPELGPRRVLLHDRETGDGRMYALLVSGPEADWPRQREVVDEMTGSFCTDAECPAADGS